MILKVVLSGYLLGMLVVNETTNSNVNPNFGKQQPNSFFQRNALSVFISLPNIIYKQLQRQVYNSRNVYIQRKVLIGPSNTKCIRPYIY